MSDEKWSWWVGHDEERYHTECGSRDEAVRIAKEKCEGGYIVEAMKPANIEVSDYFCAERFIEDAEEVAQEYYGDPDGCDLLFDLRTEHQDDLQAMVRAAIDAWQEKHGLVFTGWRFSASRNHEYIPADEPEADESGEE